MTDTAPACGAATREQRSPLLEPAFGRPRTHAQGTTIDAPVAGWQPPAEFAHLHDPAFVQDFWRRLLHRVEHPVEVDRSLGVRRVQVLGGCLFEFGPAGCVSTSMWRCPPGGPPQRVPVPPDRIAIDGVPFRWHWLDEVIYEGFVAEHLDACGSAKLPGLDAYERWLFARLRRALIGHADLRAMRRRVREALAIDPWVLAVARRAELGGQPTRAGTVNRVIEHREAVEKLDREAPNLIPLYLTLSRDDWARDAAEPTQQLRSYLGSLGYSPRLWRALTRAKGRLLRDFLVFYRGDPRDSTLDFLRVLDLLGTRNVPSRSFLWTLMQQHGSPARPPSAYFARVDDLRTAWRRLAHLVETAQDGEQRERREGTFHLIASWLASGDKPVGPEVHRRLDWEGYFRRAREWQAWRRARMVHRAAWTTPFRRTYVGALEVLALTSAFELWKEAWSMRHCADKFADRCAAGGLLVVSIRKAGRTRPLATAALRQGAGTWTLEAVTGFANTRPAEEAVNAAIEVLARLSDRAATAAPARVE
ncbi:MAG: PcfJ domain-containing protein [Betaproteobacteria bacterium]|nr:PcfJ domain-containing protein [Betaproteobacteria bacterium]